MTHIVIPDKAKATQFVVFISAKFWGKFMKIILYSKYKWANSFELLKLGEKNRSAATMI